MKYSAGVDIHTYDTLDINVMGAIMKVESTMNLRMQVLVVKRLNHYKNDPLKNMM